MKHILIVDDLDIKRAVLADSIRSLIGDSAPIVEASTRAEAEEVFQKHQPELIFMDGSFPLYPGHKGGGGAGLRFVQDLIQLGYMGIIVACSGDPDQQEDLLAAGCQYKLSAQHPMLGTLQEILERAGFRI